MKILYVAASPVPSTAANSVHVVKMAQALARNGHQTELYVPIPKHTKHHPDTKRDIFALYGVEPLFKFSQHTLLPSRLGLMLFSLGAYIHAHLIKADFVFTRCLPTATLMALMGMPTLYERHSDFGEGRNLNKFMYSTLIKSGNHKGTIVVSKALKDFFVSNFAIQPDKVIIAADGSDPIPDTHYPSPFAKQAGRKSVGYIGHLYKGRGIEVIADAAKACPECDFHIVGGTDSDLAYWRQELAPISNITLHGHVTHAETKNFLMNVDMVVAPYQKRVEVAGGGNTERWMSPLKIFEYMSSGKPLICSDMPVLREVLRPDENCILCPPDDIFSWTSAIKMLASNPELSAKIAAAAKHDFLENYTWQTRAKRIIRHAFGTGQSGKE